MELQNNPRCQLLADRRARKDGCFLFAEYVGVNDGRLVYRTMHEDSREYIEGYPILIYVDQDGKVSESFGEESLDVLGSMPEPEYTKGKDIYERYKRLLDCPGECASFERRYWNEVVSMVEHIEDYMPLDRDTVFRFLEAADRLGMQLELCTEKESLYDTDFTCHYVALVQENEYTEEENHWACGGNTGMLPGRITPSKVNHMKEKEVFVFGSNKQGMHRSGAAAFAMKRFGAEWGVGEGLTGRSYALPTMEGRESLKEAVERFISFARENDGLTFYVTPVGCGIAGYTPEDVAPLFRKAAELENVNLPVSFWKELM